MSHDRHNLFERQLHKFHFFRKKEETTALIIRSYEVMSHDEIKRTLVLAGMLDAFPTSEENDSLISSKIYSHLQIIIDKQSAPGMVYAAYESIYGEIKGNPAFRQYIQDQFAKKGHVLILHGDRDIPSILLSLEKLPHLKKYTILAITGGHGLTNVALSGIYKRNIENIKNTLQDKKITFNAIILGSCFSASFAEMFRSFLGSSGVMISDTISCGNQNHYNELIDYLCDNNRPLLQLPSKQECDEVRKARISHLLFNIPLSQIDDDELLTFTENLACISLSQISHDKIQDLRVKYHFLDVGIKNVLSDTMQYSLFSFICEKLRFLILKPPRDLTANFSSTIGDYLEKYLKEFGNDGRFYAQIACSYFSQTSIDDWDALINLYWDDQSGCINVDELHKDILCHSETCDVSVFDMDLWQDIFSTVKKLIHATHDDLKRLTDTEFRNQMLEYLREPLEKLYGVDGRIFAKTCYNFCFYDQPRITTFDQLSARIQQFDIKTFLKFEEKKRPRVVVSHDQEIQEILIEIRAANRQAHVTGKCISSSCGHRALKLDSIKTGIPLCGENRGDYKDNAVIVSILQKSNGIHEIHSDLDKINLNSQIEKFNTLFQASLMHDYANDSKINWMRVGLFAAAGVFAVGSITAYAIYNKNKM